MTAKIAAIYRRGVLRPQRRLPLAEGARVDVLVLADVPSQMEKQQRVRRAKRTPARILGEIAALSVGRGVVETSSRDHDRILYGKPASK